MEILELSMASRSSKEISSPLRSSSSMKVVIPLWRKMPFKWLVKPLRVSSPLKLKNTSYLYRRLKEEEEAPLLVQKAIVMWIYRQKGERKKDVMKLEM